MKIKHIIAENFMGVRSVNIELNAPVTLLCGQNGAGKSSTIEAVRAALCNELDRVKLKKEYGVLVSEGEKAGSVIVEHSEGRSIIKLPSGKNDYEGAELNPFLPFVMDASRFSALDESGRRSMLFKLLKVSTTAADMSRRLVDEGHCDAALVEQIAPMLASGFDAAHKKAKEEATAARGAWKGVTGETYGENKAESWKPADVESVSQDDLKAAQEAVTQANTAHSEAMRAYGAVEQQARQYAAEQERASGLVEQAAKLDRISAKLALDSAELEVWKEKLASLPPEPGAVDVRPAMACPDCGVMLVMHGGKLAHHEPGKPEDADITAKRAEYRKAVDLYAHSVESGMRDKAIAERAKTALAEIKALTPVEAGAVTQARTEAEKLGEVETAARQTLSKLLAQQAECTASKTKQERAKQFHAEAVGWSKLAEWLSPDGLPARIVADALTPFNRKLAQCAQGAEWFVPLIGADMGITASGRQYRLLSESEKWRVDAMLTVAIAHFAGLHMVVLDRFDVLDTEGRSQLLYWLSDMATAGEIEQAIIAGTMKDKPKSLPDGFDAVWIERGFVRDGLKEAA